MKVVHIVCIVVVMLGLVSFAAARGEYKDLGGEVEVESELMRAPQKPPRGHSTSKIVQLEVDDEATVEIDIEESELKVSMLFEDDDTADLFDLDMQLPGDDDFKDANAEAEAGNGIIAKTKGNRFHGKGFVGKNKARKGKGKFRIKRKAGKNGQSKASVGRKKAVLVVSSRSTINLLCDSQLPGLVGSPISIACTFSDSQTQDSNDLKNAFRGGDVTVTSPSGSVSVVALEKSSKTEFGASFTPNEAGEYQLDIEADGKKFGTKFSRSHLDTVSVAEPTVELTGENELVCDPEDDDLYVLTVGVAAAAGFELKSSYQLYGELVGCKANRNKAETSTIVGGVSDVEDGKLSFSVNKKWLSRKGLKRGFKLQNVRVTCIGTYATLASAAQMDVNAANDVGFDFVANDQSISDAMRTGKGPRRGSAGGRRLLQSTSHQILLVHGYCSSNVWGSQTSYFTNRGADQVRVFLDLDKNRSHDQFARCLFGLSSAPSDCTWTNTAYGCGVVAHSQGGAAALHAWSRYWTCLDYSGSAYGGRNGVKIHSVGTPYQGTNIAGVLASLGSIFGVGCSSQNDLTYGGASAWLSTVSTYWRSFVNARTTSFEDKWWRYDYCQILVDPFLSDPDDGTTEKAYGQLPGGTMRGHKEDWCHTSGMRDPPQVTDGSWNNIYGAEIAY